MDTEESNHSIYIERQVRVPDYTMTCEHFHQYYEIFYLKTGNCIYSVNGSRYHLSAGDMFIVAPGEPHCTRYEGTVPCERTIVYWMPEVVPEAYWQRHPDMKKKLSHSGKVVLAKKRKQRMEALLDRMLEENRIPDEYSHEFLQLQMLTLLLNIQRDGIFVYEKIRHDNSISSDIEDALRYIAQNFALPITLDEVAAQVGLTPTYLSRKFKKFTGTTFKEYMNHIRIRQAKQMLLTTDDTITQIALSCGFNSSNYFKDCFRRVNGVSPSVFRKQSKNHSFEYEIK